LSRQYRKGTLILETEFANNEGAVTLVDFMPPRGAASDLVRLVVGTRGRVAMRTELVLRFDYGATVPWVTRLKSGVLRAVAGPDMTILQASVPVHGEDLKTIGEFTVGAGETASFVLAHARSYGMMPTLVDPLEALEATEAFWREWSSRGNYGGEWSEAVQRSMIVLKALTYAPTGGLVAAPTTSLPEWIGGSRNWDYRFCWLRDATFALLTLMDGGYYDEAYAWREWLLRAVAGSPSQLSIMYGIRGERRVPEWEVNWLPGYEGSRPVRVGNAAAQQFQLDVFGEVMDALYQAARGGLGQSAEQWALQRALLDHLERVWELPDEGIWEVRGPRQHFTHSKAMAWVAFDRAIRSAEEFALAGPLERWRALCHRIHEDVCGNGFDPDLGAFVQAYGSRNLDASALLLPLVGFLPADDHRVVGTVRAVERRLLRDGLVLRYDTTATDDGLPAGEGAFLACSFWLADNYILQGRYEDARRLFTHLLALRNDVGLLAEEYDPHSKRQLGNFPQAFSHVALIDTAFNLSKDAARPAEQRADGVGS
jgi:GH15 family glucan-1,4-alpha-glucosidase